MSPLSVLTALPPATVLGALGALLAIAALLFAWRVYRRRREQAAQLRAITDCAYEYLRNILVPDPQGVPLHIDFLLMTARGIVVVDLRDFAGNIFGGDQMDEWTVINGAQRFTFGNPQAGLYDRQASVRLVARETPVEGRIVFGKRGLFPKGLPSQTRMLSALASDFPINDRQTIEALPEPWLADWRNVKAACTPSSLVAPKSAV
jgi:hypothetical protein